MFGLPLSLFADLNGSIVFAPPWLKRLYAQRGVFLDWSPLDPDLDVREACFRVLFPPDPSFALSAARVDRGRAARRRELADLGDRVGEGRRARTSAARLAGGRAGRELRQAAILSRWFQARCASRPARDLRRSVRLAGAASTRGLARSRSRHDRGDGQAQHGAVSAREPLDEVHRRSGLDGPGQASAGDRRLSLVRSPLRGSVTSSMRSTSSRRPGRPSRRLRPTAGDV